MGGHSHRAGKLKQTNKKNKRSTASKRSLNRKQGGKVAGTSTRKSLKASTTNEGSAKANRLNAAKQKRDASKKTLLQARRGLLSSAVASSVGISASKALSTPPPRVVGIISLSEQEGELEECVRQFIVGGADRVIACESDGTSRTVTAAYNAHTKGGQPHLTLLTNSTSFHPQYASSYSEEDASVNAALDLCRVCDLVLFLVDSSSVTSSLAINATAAGGASGGGGMSIGATSIKTSANTAHLDHLISERGDRILTAIKAQGMPTPVTLIVHKEIDGDGSPGGIIDLKPDDAMDDDDDEEDEYEEAMSMGVTTQRSSKSIRRTHIRRRAELKKYISRFAVTEFGENSKVFEIDIVPTTSGSGVDKMEDNESVNTNATSSFTTKTQSETSCAALIRMLCTMSASGTSWVAESPRPFLITDGSISAPCKDIKTVQYDETTQELKLTGYIRGNTPWNVNHLAHIPHLGTFAVKNIKLAGLGKEEQLPPIVAMGRKQRTKKSGDDNVTMSSNTSLDDGILLAESNPEERESLEMFASPDVLEGEQNLIGFDEDGYNLDDDGDALNDSNNKKSDVFQPGTSRPAGWSDYQSAWLDAIGEDDEDAEDRGELAFALNKKNGDATTVGGDAFMDDDDDVNAEEKRALLAQRKQDRESDLQFPDEVDYEEEGSARDRYARYRSLKSFRKSYWDPKENLPDSYGAVYHFSSFRATQKDVMLDMKDMSDIVMKKGCGVGVSSKEDGDAAMDDDSEDEEEEAIARACVPSGAYVTITLEGVPSQSYARLSPDTILTAVSLLPHENKVSVLHMGLSQSVKCENDPEVPIKSKDVLTFRCGWRTWQGRPVFSQNNLNSDKHKFERYMPTGGAFFACTVFGPVTYAPCPVLVFREATEGEGLDSKRREFLAHGSMLGADADRIVLKRIILTGYPTRVHKRHATVKYMFYNPDDVMWFMPAGLTTKHGLQGNIIQSVGDHGVMKCLFNAPIKQHDTVCLALYKRIYPKLAPTGDEEEQHLVVL